MSKISALENFSLSQVLSYIQKKSELKDFKKNIGSPVYFPRGKMEKKKQD